MADTVVVKRTENRLIVTKQDPKAVIAAPYVKNINQYAYSLTVLGYYENLSALVAGVSTPDVGDVYGVGTSAPYTIYIWDGTSWVDNGTIKGDKGDPTEWLRGTVDPNTEGVDGDLYLNYTTWHVWEKISGTWTDRGSIKGADGEGTGDVIGPASSTDGNLAAFDGVTGKLIKDSGKAIADFAEASHTHGYLANIVEDTTPELGGPLDCNNELVYWDLYSISGTAIDVANGNKQKLTLSDTNITVTLATPDGACAFHLFIYQGATARTITWPTIKWLDGTAPVLSVSNGRFVVCLAWDGASWFGSWGAYS